MIRWIYAKGVRDVPALTEKGYASESEGNADISMTLAC